MEEIYVDIRMKNKWIRETFENQDMVSIEDLLTKIEDLIDEKEEIRLKYEELEADVADNYIRAPLASQLDINDRDFI